MPDMAETWLRELLERATAAGPPTGPAALARNSLRAGIRLRRRRRAHRAAAGAAAVAVVSAAALAVTGAVGNPEATDAKGPPTVYVLGGGQSIGTLTPISTLTNRPGKPAVVRTGNEVGSLGTQLAITPGGKTIWVTDGGDTVTPVSTATGRAGEPIRVVDKYDEGADQVLATPDGKTVYVLDSSDTVTPISTATHRAGRPVELGQGAGGGAEMAITPDGKTLYVALFYPSGTGPSYVIPIATATNRPGKRIRVATAASALVVTPDGKTVYVIGQPLKAGPSFVAPASQRIEVTPIPTATNRAGKPVLAGQGSVGTDTPVAMAPGGQTIYIPDSTPNGVIPFSTATNTPGKLIGFGAALVQGITITPDGSTAYVTSQPGGGAKHVVVPGDGGVLACTGPPGTVTPIATATNTAGKPIKVGCFPLAAAVTPDGQTIYVGSESGTVTPVATATGRPGKPIKLEGPEAIVITP
jgi:DNA-binding beta-propeller fold protein YncE